VARSPGVLHGDRRLLQDGDGHSFGSDDRVDSRHDAQKDWETITDDWAEHDFTRGAQNGDIYPAILAARYGKVANLADFVRKAQLMNYEAYRAMYEGRNAQMFHPTTAIITWMSHPAQPSFVWQLYHYDLEPNSSLFAVKKAGRWSTSSSTRRREIWR